MRVVGLVLLGAVACGRISFDPLESTTGDAPAAADGRDDSAAGACAPQHVNRGCMVGSGTTALAPFAMPVVAGNLLVVAVDYDGTTGTITVTDTTGNTYAPAAPIARATLQSQQVFYARATTSGANTVTATFSIAAGQSGIHLHEYSEVTHAGAAMSMSGNSTSALTPTIVTTDANGMAFAFANTPASITIVATPFTARETCNGDMTADAPITAGSHQTTFTLDSQNDWTTTMVELRCN